MGYVGRRIAVGALAAATVVIASLPASATYAGSNGDIVYRVRWLGSGGVGGRLR